MTDTLRVAGESSGQRDARAPRPPGQEAFLLFDERLLHTSANAIRLAACDQFETIVVNTRRSVYEIIILDGKSGAVLVRGGSDFPEFRRATFVGSTTDGRAVKVNTIDVGLRMELHIGRGSVITSPVAAIVRGDRRVNDPSVS